MPNRDASRLDFALLRRNDLTHTVGGGPAGHS